MDRATRRYKKQRYPLDLPAVCSQSANRSYRPLEKPLGCTHLFSWRRFPWKSDCHVFQFPSSNPSKLNIVALSLPSSSSFLKACHRSANTLGAKSITSNVCTQHLRFSFACSQYTVHTHTTARTNETLRFIKGIIASFHLLHHSHHPTLLQRSYHSGTSVLRLLCYARATGSLHGSRFPFQDHSSSFPSKLTASLPFSLQHCELQHQQGISSLHHFQRSRIPLEILMRRSDRLISKT